MVVEIVWVNFCCVVVQGGFVGLLIFKIADFHFQDGVLETCSEKLSGVAVQGGAGRLLRVKCSRVVVHGGVLETPGFGRHV